MVMLIAFFSYIQKQHLNDFYFSLEKKNNKSSNTTIKSSIVSIEIIKAFRYRKVVTFYLFYFPKLYTLTSENLQLNSRVKRAFLWVV